MLIPPIIFIFYNVKIVFKKWEIKSCCPWQQNQLRKVSVPQNKYLPSLNFESSYGPGCGGCYVCACVLVGDIVSVVYMRSK